MRLETFNELEEFDINKFESDDKRLSKIIDYTKKTHNNELLNLCEKMYYSIKNGVSIDNYLYTAMELYKSLEMMDDYKRKIIKIKLLEKDLKEKIAEQDKLTEMRNALQEKHNLDAEKIEQMKAYLDSKQKPVQEKINTSQDKAIDEDDVTDYSHEENTSEESKENTSLLLLDNDLTKEFNNFEENKLEDNLIHLKYKSDDNTSYISIIDTDLDSLVSKINKIFLDADNMKNTKNKKETIKIFSDVIEDIKTYYQYKEYVRYYYNSYKNKLDKALDYEEHKQLLADLTDKINIIINSFWYYFSINEISFKELNQNYNFDDNILTLVFKLLGTPGYKEPINTNDILYSMYDKNYIDSINTKKSK